jgi:polar amino acid transport system substrate-binding protein
MKTRLMRTLAGGAALSLGLALSACGSDDGNGSDTDSGDASGLATITEGTLTVCSDVPYPPFEDFDEGSELGYKGFDVDIVKEIADGLGLDLVIQDSEFDPLQSGQTLNAGQCDLAASAMTITEEREQNIDFSDPYYDSKQSLLVPSGSDIASIDDLSGKRVGVQRGTTGKAYTEENAPDAQIVTFPSDAEMWSAVQAGNVDALLQDLPVNVEHTRNGDFEIVEEYETDESYGLALKKGSELTEPINEQLSEMRESGRYDEIYDSYFDTE